MTLSKSPDRDGEKHRRRPPTAEVEFAEEPTSAEPFVLIDDLLTEDPDGVFRGGR